MLVAIQSTILPKLPSRLYFYQAQEYLVVTVRLGEVGGEMYKNKGDKEGKWER